MDYLAIDHGNQNVWQVNAKGPQEVIQAVRETGMCSGDITVVELAVLKPRQMAILYQAEELVCSEENRVYIEM